MSNKFILLTTLFLILISQHNSVLAGPSEDDEDMYAYPEARLQMGAIMGDSDSTKSLLSEEIQSNAVPKREEPSKTELLSDWLTSSLINPDLSLVMQNTEDEILTDALAKKLVFTNAERISGFDVLNALRYVSTDEALKNLDSTNLVLSSLDIQTTPFGAQGLVDDELAADLGRKLQFSSKSASIFSKLIKALNNASPGFETYMTYETPD